MSVALNVNVPGTISQAPVDQMMVEDNLNSARENAPAVDNQHAPLINRVVVIHTPQMSSYECLTAIAVGCVNGCWDGCCSVLAGSR